ncbi:hypothetical protein RRF57_004696 [Xylaria bambusicola]|uniref:Uncharacterized protein n=1 Tax=Xylaria bambusicola TaxID=326684 RepID=A0AAN7UM88_9PEZI
MPWKIVISGTNVAVQRIINLTMVSPSTVTVTATPTVIVGITSTPNPTTVFSTIGTQTQTLILQPGTVTTPCVGSTTTLTVTPTKATYVTVSTVVRTTTDATVTRESTTTVVKTAYCHYTDDFPAPPPNTICIGLACGYPPDLPTPTVCVGFSCSKPAAQTGNVPDTPTTSSVEVLKILATTVTVTETTYTVTQTSITQLPTPTVTESVIKITTATVTPKPSTVCGGQKPGVTISLTLPQATVTQTSLSYSTRHATGTVTVVDYQLQECYELLVEWRVDGSRLVEEEMLQTRLWMIRMLQFPAEIYRYYWLTVNTLLSLILSV